MQHAVPQRYGCEPDCRGVGVFRPVLLLKDVQERDGLLAGSLQKAVYAGVGGGAIWNYKEIRYI